MLLLLVTAKAMAADVTPLKIDLWPSEPPGPHAKTDEVERDLTKPEDKLIAGQKIIKLGHVRKPQMHVHLPEKSRSNGGAIIICPGGGFSILAWDLEGTEAAQWLNSLGFAAVVLKYRVPTREYGDALNEQGTAPMKAVGPLMDAQRAISLTRAHCEEWRLDAKRIGIMGFSAGGETACLAALSADRRLYTKIDAADAESWVPNFVLLIYPGGFLDKETGQLKPHIKVRPDTPPMFLAMAQDDHVNSLNCTLLYNALTAQKVAAELHLYPHGGHGFGLRRTSAPVTGWPEHAAKWFQEMGVARP
jgi:acetyl esterase/lipase